jgi:hypothetical protein
MYVVAYVATVVCACAGAALVVYLWHGWDNEYRDR